jgi:hypothetical protein
MKKEVREYTIDESGMLGVNAISLVEFPAIEVDFIALSKKLQFRAYDEEKRIVYGAVIIPEQLIYREDADGTPYYGKFTTETTEKISQEFFIRNAHHNHTIEHKFAVNGLVVVESWLKHSSTDKSVSLGFEDYPNGTWFIGSKVMNDEVWQEVKKGTFKGFSLEGFFNEKVALSKKEQEFYEELSSILMAG